MREHILGDLSESRVTSNGTVCRLWFVVTKTQPNIRHFDMYKLDSSKVIKFVLIKTNLCLFVSFSGLF